MTSLNMRGFHISLLRVTEHPEWVELLDSPTSAPSWPATYKKLEHEETSDLGELIEQSLPKSQVLILLIEIGI